MITNTYQIETAEGIDIDILPAGIAARTYAFTIDLMLRGVIVLVCMIIFNMFGDLGTGLTLITFFVVEWFYPVLFEIYKGATPGKSAFKLQVVTDKGLPVSFSGSLTRNLFRVIDILPFAYVSGAICMILNKQSKRIGDIVAGTTVVYKNKRTKPIFFNFDKTQVQVPKMSTEQQLQIIAFAHRSKYLSESRQIELANILAPVLNTEGPEAVDKLKTIAGILVGKL